MPESKPQHIMMMSLVVVIHLRELSTVAPVWDWMADAASALQKNWFDGNRFGFVPTVKRETTKCS